MFIILRYRSFCDKGGKCANFRCCKIMRNLQSRKWWVCFAQFIRYKVSMDRSRCELPVPCQISLFYVFTCVRGRIIETVFQRFVSATTVVLLRIWWNWWMQEVILVVRNTFRRQILGNCEIFLFWNWPRFGLVNIWHTIINLTLVFFFVILLVELSPFFLYCNHTYLLTQINQIFVFFTFLAYEQLKMTRKNCVPNLGRPRIGILNTFFGVS